MFYISYNLKKFKLGNNLTFICQPLDHLEDAYNISMNVSVIDIISVSASTFLNICSPLYSSQSPFLNVISHQNSWTDVFVHSVKSASIYM